jgi:hypothetical protein
MQGRLGRRADLAPRAVSGRPPVAGGPPQAQEVGVPDRLAVLVDEQHRASARGLGMLVEPVG